jgi:cation/acetate symporter
MLIGFPITLLYIIGTIYMDWELWGDIANISAGIFGLPIAFFVTIVVSLLTAPPSEEIQDFVVSLRKPENPVKVIEQTVKDTNQPTAKVEAEPLLTP